MPGAVAEWIEAEEPIFASGCRVSPFIKVKGRPDRTCKRKCEELFVFLPLRYFLLPLQGRACGIWYFSHRVSPYVKSRMLSPDGL